MSIAQLISPERLAMRQKTPGLVILDCRFALEDADYGQRNYAQGHIEGASFADLKRDLSGPVIKGKTGRHPLPEPAVLLESIQAWGINADSDVVLYDDGPGMFAARAWWLLAWMGKREGVYLLDGGLKAWHAAGLPLSLDALNHEPGNFSGEPDMSMLLSGSRLQSRLGRVEMTLIDARAEARFRGDVEPLDPVAGHIPGAQCAACTDNLGPDGRFLPPGQLRQRFAEKLQGRPPESLVSYCGS
ncbi:sulfurtransferase, partial [Pseudomonas syringae]